MTLSAELKAHRTDLKPLIVALDVETSQEAMGLTRRLAPHVDVFKIGPVLFLKYGGTLLSDLHATGAKIFLDLKFHDIPSVVRRAVERAGEWGVYSATIHAAGGLEMMREAAAAEKRPKLWGVTVLTSMDDGDLKSIGVARRLAEQVEALAKLAVEAKLNGVIASVREAAIIKKSCGANFDVVTPGIRTAGGSDDQKRTQTPAAAVESGADFFVMGRPVLEAKDPVEFVQQIYKTLELRRNP